MAPSSLDDFNCPDILLSCSNTISFNRYFEGDLTIIIFFPQWDVFIFRMHLHIPRILFPLQDIFPKEKDVISVFFEICLKGKQEQQQKALTSRYAVFAAQRPGDPEHSPVDLWDHFLGFYSEDSWITGGRNPKYCSTVVHQSHRQRKEETQSWEAED